MDDGAITLDLIGRTLLDIQTGQRSMRAEIRDVRTIVLGQVDQVRRIERRVNELKDDLELMMKADLMGRLGNHETRMERLLDQFRKRLDALEAAPRSV